MSMEQAQISGNVRLSLHPDIDSLTLVEYGLGFASPATSRLLGPTFMILCGAISQTNNILNSFNSFPTSCLVLFPSFFLAYEHFKGEEMNHLK